MREKPPINVRRADPMDDSALTLLADRMADFPLPPWRTPSEIADTCLPQMRAAVHQRGFEGVLLVAEQGRGNTLGAVLVTVRRDAWNGERYGRMDVLAVQHGDERRGVASALLDAAETWAREQGLRRLACDLFDTNWRARGFCEHHGFQRDTVRYLKEL